MTTETLQSTAQNPTAQLSAAQLSTAQLSAAQYPMDRAAGCPFDPAPRLGELRTQAPLSRVRIWDGSRPWLVTRHADQRTLLADRRISADPDRPGYPMTAAGRSRRDDTSIGFILMDDPEHARLRRMVTAPFMIKRVEAMRPAVQRIVDDLIGELLAGPRPVDLVEAFALPVPSLVICTLLGVPYSDHDAFQADSRDMIRVSTPAEERDAAFRRLYGYLDKLIADKIAKPGDDLLSTLAERIGAGELSRRDAAGIGVLLLIAGHETTANMIALGTLALLEHPDQLDRLRAADDPKDVARAVEELLRYLTITHNGRRRVALEDIEIGGQTIKAGDGVILPNDIGNRDPDVFADPDRLDLDRDARRHLAFGFGVHQCLGQPLARMELQVVYGTLYRRIPGLRLATAPENLRFKHDGAVYGVYDLPVTW